MADSGLLKFINRGVRFVTSKASATYVGLKTLADPATSFDIILPNTLPTVVPRPLSMGLDGTLQYGNNFSTIVTVATSKTLALSDSYTTQLCTATSTITIPLNATVAFPIGTEIAVLQSTTGTTTLALTAGVTVTDRNGLTNTLTTVRNYTQLKKTGTNSWIAVNPIPNSTFLPGDPTTATQPVGTNNATIATTSYVAAATTAMSSSLSLTGQADFGRFAHNNYYFTNSFFANAFGGIGVFFDRLQAADRRFVITSNPGLSGAAVSLFDTSGDSSAGWAGPNVTATLEVDWSTSNTPNYTFSAGFIAIQFYDSAPNYLTPLSVKVELYQVTTASWINVGTFFPADNTSSPQNKALTIPVANSLYTSKMRFTLVTRPTAQYTYIVKIEYFASRTDPGELPQYLLSSSSSAQVVDAPSTYFGKIAGSNPNTQISPGAIILNNSPTISTSTTTGSFVTSGIGIGGGRGFFSLATSYDDSAAASQVNRSLYFNNGNTWAKRGDGSNVALSPLSLAAPVAAANVLTIPFDGVRTVLAQYNVSAPVTLTPATSRIQGSSTILVLSADGTNIPTLGAGVRLFSDSATYSNVASTLHVYTFYELSGTVWVRIAR